MLTRLAKAMAGALAPKKPDNPVKSLLQTIDERLAAEEIEAAAQLLFRKSAEDLSAADAIGWVQYSLRTAGMLEKRNQFPLAYDLLRRLASLSPERILPRLASLAAYCGRIGDAAALLDAALASSADAGLRYARATLFLENGELDAAKNLLQQVEAAESVSLASYVRRDLNYVTLVHEAAEMLDGVPQPADPKGLVVICNDGPFIALWSTLPARRLREHGYATVCASSRAAFPMTLPADPKLAPLHGVLSCNCTLLAGDDTAPQEFRHEWTVDWKNKIVRTGNINAYQGIFERLSTILKRYTIDIERPDVRSIFKYYLLQCDRALSLCERIRKTVANDGVPVRFLISGSHFAPYFVVKQFCGQLRGACDMQCITFYASYEHYYNNLGSDVASKVSVVNDTRFPDQRSGMYARKENFERWLARLPNPAAEAKKALTVLDFNRTGTVEPPAEAGELLARIKAHRDSGRKVVCLFGKIVYDMAVPYDGGPAHADMVDWLNHTIDSARGSDTLLLIKPHPHEVKAEMHQPAEMFLDLVKVSTPSNVVLMQHHWLNMRELIPHLDAGILWHGTSALELGMAGVPVLVASHWGRLDHPIEFASPVDRDDYARMIRQPEAISAPPGYAERCALLSRYLATDEIMIPYPYARIPVLAPKAGQKPTLPGWNTAIVQEYLRSGDPHLDRIVSMCL